MSIRQSLCNRLSAIGLKQERVHSLVDTTMKWLTKNGAEWTVERLKEIKLIYVHELAHVPYQPKSWISRRANGRPKGPWGSLDLSTPKSTSQTLNALNVYTAFLSGSATRKQLQKFLGSATESEPSVQKPIGPVDTSSIPPMLNLSRMATRQLSVLEPPRPWSSHVWGKTKAPLSNGTTVPEDKVEVWLPDNGLVLGSIGLRLKQYRSDLLSAKIGSFVKEGTFCPTTGGKIAYLQEPGYKLRAIANPYRIWQILMDPLKRDLFSRLRLESRDCTYDQRKGIEIVQSWLKDGHTVHSVDLSDATNLFPLSFQVAYLKSLYDMRDQSTANQIDYFIRCSRARWLLPDGRNISWSRGQPLGIGPSFAAFSLCHHQVIKEVGRLDLYQGTGDYVILGDDICIRGDHLANAYKEKMMELGCSISPSKTLSSSSAAEFAGRIILPDGDVPTFKWRSVSDRSFLDVVRSLGPCSKGLLKKRQRQIVNILSEVPEFFGGLGWNPKGRPLSERVSLAVDLGLMDIPDEERIVRSSSSTHVQVLNKILYNREEAMPIIASERHATLSPARTKFEQLQTLLGVTDLICDPELVGGDLKVAAPSGDPRGPTTLEVLERKVLKWRRSLSHSSGSQSVDSSLSMS